MISRSLLRPHRSLPLHLPPSRPFSPFMHSRLLPGPERIRESIYVDNPLSFPPCGSRTVADLLARGKERSRDGPCLGEIKEGRVEWSTYGELIEEAQILTSGLVASGLQPGQTTNVGVAGINSKRHRPLPSFHPLSRYTTSFQALHFSSTVCVPIYHLSKMADQCHIINFCHCEWVLCDSSTRAKLFLEEKDKGNLGALKKIVVMEPDRESLPVVESVEVLDWETVCNRGRQARKTFAIPSTDNVYIITHTSGTTGRPKGVPMTHANIMASVGSMQLHFSVPGDPSGMSLQFSPDDTYFSYLPCAHIFETNMHHLMFYNGCKIGIYRGDIQNILADASIIRPSLFPGVPRIWNRFHDAIHSKMKENPLKNALFEVAKSYKLWRLRAGVLSHDTWADKAVFSKCASFLGGRVRMMYTGGAPMAQNVKDFSRIAYGGTMIEGYGQTEGSAAGMLTAVSDTSSVDAGAPVPWAQCKLVDAPELGYLAKDDKGEIAFRGACIMKGYYKDEKATKETMDAEGWMLTGDIGQWLPNGSLRITDRKKAPFKLSQGDFVSPEQIEVVYMQNCLVNQLFITCRSTRSFLVGIIVLNAPNVRALLEEKGGESSSLLSLPDSQLLVRPEVKEAVLESLNSFGRSRGLQSIELVGDLYVSLEEFTQEKQLMTASMKLRRAQLVEYYKKEVDDMYSRATIT